MPSSTAATVRYAVAPLRFDSVTGISTFCRGSTLSGTCICTWMVRGAASTASHATPTARPGPRSCSLPGRNALAST